MSLWTPHRTRSPRQCDRCREHAVWNLTRKGHPQEYACTRHAIALAYAYDIEAPLLPEKAR